MWASVIATVIGLWLMAAPAVLGYGAPASTVDRIIGPIAASVGWISVWAVTRPIRWLNLPLGAALVLAPLALSYPGVAFANSIALGVALAAFAPVRGKPTARFGGGWSAVLRPEPPVIRGHRDG